MRAIALDCQSWSGSAFSQQLVVSEDALTVTGGGRISLPEPQRIAIAPAYVRKLPCSHLNTNSARPGIAMIRAGSSTPATS